MIHDRSNPTQAEMFSPLQRWAMRIFFVALLLFVTHSKTQSAVAQEASPGPAAKSVNEEKPAETPAPEAAPEPAATEGKKAEEPAAETPPAQPPAPSDPNRDKIAPDDGGQIQFNYVGQPWAQVLQDFADADGKSLDWQELPTDTLNLTTQHKYTLQEARDLLNRHLLARGFTMLTEGEVLSIVKIDSLDPSLIPRTDADELDKFAPHDFMRVTFPLPDSMEPAQAAEDVKLLLSPNAKVVPLLASRRLLVIDAVTNLRDVRSLFSAEQSETKHADMPREFLLKYRRADYVADQVMVILGLDPNSRKTPDELKLETQRIQMQMEMLKKDKDISSMLKKQGPEVYIAVNRLQNSILVNAPPKLMATIEQTVKQLDVPGGEDGDDAEPLSLVQYQLGSASPEDVLKALEDIVSTDPRSRFQADPATNTLLATATASDHEKILEIIEKLDASKKKTVTLDELAELPPYEQVRVKFVLPFALNINDMMARIQPLLGEKSKVTPIHSIRTLMVTDKAENLLEVREMLKAEEALLAAQDTVQEFVVKHRRAEEVAGKVLTLMGEDPAALSNPDGARFDAQGMRLFITVNQRQNSLRVTAHPEVLKLIEQSIKQFDLPESDATSEIVAGQSLKLYKVVGQDIHGVIGMLREVGGVSALARLQVGPASETLYAIANEEDQKKIEKFLLELAPPVIQTVDAEELEELPAQETVRIRMQLPLSADVYTLSAQLQGLLAGRGTVQTLDTSKQIIVTGSAAELIDIREMVEAEAKALTAQDDFHEFPLEHRRADEMYDQVLTMLGIDPSLRINSPPTLQAYLQQLKVSIVANPQRNSLMVSAGADKMQMIERLLKQLDVAEEHGTTDDGQQRTMVPYKVTGRDPTAVVKALREIGGLSPRSRLQGDVPSQTVYAYATKADHEKIQAFVDEVDPSLVHNLNAEELEDYPAQEMARVSFQLPVNADVVTMVPQIQGMLGPTGSVQALDASKQLVVRDTVASLIAVRDVLDREAKALEAQDNIREFPLEHRRAEEMVDQVLTMLGVDPSLRVSNPPVYQSQLQLMKLFVAANPQRNSLMVNAEADKMQLVERIVKQLDVAEGSAAATGADRLTLVPYKVEFLDVAAAEKALKEIGGIGPAVRLQVDPVRQTLYAYATEADHEKIKHFLGKTKPKGTLRIDPDKLDEYPKYDRGRVRFQLPPAVDVIKSAEQVRGLVGEKDIVQALETSNQLVVIGSVETLLEVRDVLRIESEAQAAQKNIREFPLEHRRADEMVEQVLTMLGVDPALTTNPVEMRQELQRLKLFITANEQRNSLVVNAPVDKMLTVEQIIDQLDVPQNGEVETATARQTMTPYKIVVGDVTSVVKALTEIGNLDPRTRLQGDAVSQTLYAYASKADHQKIRQFVDEMDPNIVRSVDPDSLEDYAAHDVVRALFQLPLSAEIDRASEQITGVLGEGARVQSLKSSKQLVVVDTVANLIAVRDMLYGEQLAAKALEMPIVFPLEHRRATYVADQVMILLGLDPSSRKTSTEVNFEAQRMEMMMQQSGRSGGSPPQLGDQAVHIAVNRRQNTLLVNAPPEKIPLIERTIESIDVPVEDSGPIASGPLTMEKYQMATAGTDGVIGALEELGNLDPKTQLQSDASGKVIFAYATQADHATIKKMIAKLDGVGRSLHVRALPRGLPAKQVAGSILALVVGTKEKKKDNIPWYYSYRYRNQEEEDDDEFRVSPDVENNRLLIWATDAELEEVENFVSKLSEDLDSAVGANRKVRRLESRDPEVIQRLLEQLKSTWPGKNELEIQAPAAGGNPGNEKPKAEKKSAKEDKLTNTGERPPSAAPRFLLAQTVNKAADDEPTAPPIKIAVNEKGEIIIASEDTEALDQLQELIEQLSPAQTEFQSFQLHYIHVLDVVFNLKAYFRDELDEEEGDSILDWWGRPRDTKPEPPPITLGKRPPLRFIDDGSTNTLIVANANARQLRIIKELIDIYDRPPNSELYYQRRTEAVKIKYSQATDIANSLKEVYRDLLSSKDKEFRTEDGKQAVGASRESSYIFGDARRTIKGIDGPVMVNFSGALSIGVDEVSNSVIISAREEVLETIKETIETLDQAAKPETIVRVHSADGVLDADDLQRLVAGALSEPWLGGKPQSTSSGKSSRKSSRSRSKSSSSSKTNSKK